MNSRKNLVIKILRFFLYIAKNYRVDTVKSANLKSACFVDEARSIFLKKHIKAKFI